MNNIDNPVHVALCCDKNVEIGVHVTLWSLLSRTSAFVNIHLVYSGYEADDFDKLKVSLAKFDGRYELNIYKFSSANFQNYRGLQGNTFAFTRICLPEILSTNKVVYLDCDLVVSLDIATLYEIDLQGFAIGASGVGNIEWSLEKPFFTRLGLEPEAKYFNSGVLLMDLDYWRKHKLSARCFEFANKYPKELVTADQTVLNYVFQEFGFLELDPKFNLALYPNNHVDLDMHNEAILHFVGAPKPWDLFGEFGQKNHEHFSLILRETVFKDYRSYRDINWNRLKRFFRLLPTFARNILS